MNQDFSLLDIIKLFYKNLRAILLAGFITAVIVAGISLLMDNYYSASTIFYAASPDLAEPSPVGVNGERMKIYGNDLDVDRLLSLARSNNIVNRMIAEFNLYDHYGIDSTGNRPRYKIREKFLELYDVSKTKFGAISLSVEDKDPDLSAEMANTAREMISESAQSMIKESQKKTLDNYYNNIAQKEKQLAHLNDSISYLKTVYGIIDINAQGEVLSSNSSDVTLELEELQGRYSRMKELNLPQDSINKVSATIAGLQKKKKEIDKQLKGYAEGSADIKTMESQIGIFQSQIGLMKERYNQLLATYKSSFSTIHVVEDAEVPDMKSRPKRLYIVLAAAIIASLLTMLLLLSRESLKGVSFKS